MTPTVGFLVGEVEAVGNAITVDAGAWLHATKPNKKITTSILLKCIRYHTRLDTRVNRLGKETRTQILCTIAGTLDRIVKKLDPGDQRAKAISVSFNNSGLL